MQNRTHLPIAVMLLLSLLIAALPAPAFAQDTLANPNHLSGDAPDSRPTVLHDGRTTSISFALEESITDANGQLAAAAVSDLGWPVTELGGLDLPLHMVTVLLDDAPVNPASAPPPFRIESLDAVPYHGELKAAAVPAPPELSPTEMPEYRLPAAQTTLPEQPVVVLRDGRVRGHHVRVLGISPLFMQDGEPMLAKKLRVSVPDSQPLEGDIAALLYADSGPVTILATDDLTPPNSVARQTAAKVIVSEVGLQRVPLSALQAAGLNISDTGKLGVMRQGAAVPAQITSDALLFYAADIEDYWNATATYWVTDTGANVTRIGVRSAAPNAATQLVTEAFERGVWQANQVYSSLTPGPNGDHWFATQMRAASSTANGDLTSIDAPVAGRLPLSGNGELTLELHSSTRGRAPYDLEIKMGRKNNDGFATAKTVTATWDTRSEASDENDWLYPVAPQAVSAQDLRITLKQPDPTVVNGSAVESFAELLLDEIGWKQRVALNFRGNGAIFDGYDRSQAGTDLLRYQLQNVADGAQIYDVTEPEQPVRLTDITRNGNQILFQDGTDDGRRYLVSGVGVVQSPAVTAYRGTNVTAAASGAHLIYIAPTSLHTALKQLTDYRATQQCAAGVRCQVKTVDVQQIYDAYSFGDVNPEAIRQYLRYAVANWNPAPISVVLVGDGTQDPKNYEGNEQSPALIPPYLAYRVGDPAENTFVDPFIRQTGCDNCFAQLDGVDALTGDDPIGTAWRPGTSFFPDIMLGRLPVKNAAELRDLIGKMVRYETEYDANDPRNEKLVFLADNFIKSCSPDGPRDTAGDFATYSDEIIEALPDTLMIDRIYYDPTQIYDPADRDGDGSECNYDTARSSRGYREGNPQTVYDKVQATLRAGAGLVTYNGHASQWRWAVTERETNSTSPVAADAPEHLFYIWDVLSLNNGDQPFVSLAMSCLTSQFHKPVDWGMTVDEHLLLRSTGGAVATWGSTGLSVAQGHFALERGFHETLWAENDGRARMGDLVMGGYFEQYTESSCCDDVRRTFMLMGDPMTRVSLGEIKGDYLPIVAR